MTLGKQEVEGSGWGWQAYMHIVTLFFDAKLIFEDFLRAPHLIFCLCCAHPLFPTPTACVERGLPVLWSVTLLESTQEGHICHSTFQCGAMI